MNNLDEKLKDIVNDSQYVTDEVPDYEWPDILGKLKQAFMDAGWEPVIVLNRKQSYQATGQEIYRTPTLITEDEWKARNAGKLMTGQEWCDKFKEKLYKPKPQELPSPSAQDDGESHDRFYRAGGANFMYTKAIEAAKAAAGIES